MFKHFLKSVKYHYYDVRKLPKEERKKKDTTVKAGYMLAGLGAIGFIVKFFLEYGFLGDLIMTIGILQYLSISAYDLKTKMS